MLCVAEERRMNTEALKLLRQALKDLTMAMVDVTFAIDKMIEEQEHEE